MATTRRVSVESAIRAVTAEVAWHLRSEHEIEIASLEAGKLADLVILDKSPRRVDPEQIRDLAVLETWMDVKQVFSACPGLNWPSAGHHQRVLVDHTVFHDYDEVAIGVCDERDVLERVAVDQQQVRQRAFLDHA